MGRKLSIAAPAGMSGLVVEPWSEGEVYGVAADWGEAACTVLVYGEDGWVGSGRQVADFRHSEVAALKSEIREAIIAGGDQPDNEEVADIIAGAEECIDADVAEMMEMLLSHGDTYAGSCPADVAAEWIDAGFTPGLADKWCDIGCWDAGITAQLRDAGLTPEQALAAADALTDGLDDPAEVYTDGDPIYSACNRDINVQVIVDAAE